MRSFLNLTVVFLLLTAFSDQPLITPADIHFKRDNITLSGKFYAANTAVNSPILLLLQGFPGNENDVLGLSKWLTTSYIHVMTFNYSGTHKSEGLFSFENCQADIAAAMDYLHRPEVIEQFMIDTTNLFLGGYSMGGGMAITYAIQNPEIENVISIAGNDWGEHLEDYLNDPELKTAIDENLNSTESIGTV